MKIQKINLDNLSINKYFYIGFFIIISICIVALFVFWLIVSFIAWDLVNTAPVNVGVITRGMFCYLLFYLSAFYKIKI